MYTGPKLTNENLVFGYDTGYGVADNGVETRFYKGEPTTNILPYPEKNGRFTTANQWQSYNTNQYNSNTDFDIGTIGSVSNNIVTLSSIGHVIRSFDVLNPATTGGGVTAGTNYVIKKISSTTFSLHAYNSSQNGSQGYINPDTGFFKVHDAYANDTRVSISASGFPEMWHGAPHLPNSGLIKEIVPNGGYVKGTSCMRFHVFRGDNVRDGMAYSVYTPVTANDVITVSYWMRPTNPLGYGKSLTYSTYFGSGNEAYGGSTTVNSDGEWQHVVHQWTASVTVNFYSYFFPSGSTDKYAIDIADMQVEVNKGHATPFTLTNRSDTQGLIDLVKTTDIDVSNVSFDSTGQPEFDGTNDVITTSFPATTIPTVTIEAVVYRNQATGRYEAIVQNNTASDDALYVNPSGYLMFWPCGSSSLTVPTGQWSHVAVSYNGTTLTYIVNGTTQVVTATCSHITDWDFLRIGGHGTTDSERWIGKVAVTKVYEKSLSAAELISNYNAYKNRFNI
jgi:hypothetical protein